MTVPSRRDTLAEGLRRMAFEAETQAPGRSALAPLLFHMARAAAAGPAWAIDNWDALADAFYGIEHGLDTGEMQLPEPGRVPAQRPAPPQPPRQTAPRRHA